MTTQRKKRPAVATEVVVTGVFHPTQPFPWAVVTPRVDKAMDNLGLAVDSQGNVCHKEEAIAPEWNPAINCGE
jgi:hypothetical protein